MPSKTKKLRAQIVFDQLEQFYPEVPDCFLTHKDPYTLLLAVLLSAQCTDKRVNEVTPALFALADTPEKMAQQSESDIAAIIRPCGLTQRKAYSILELSKILVRDYQGQVPANFAALESLPGVGHKTASVVMVQAFGIPAFPVDTHIFRLAKRWGLSEGKNVEIVERDLKSLYASEHWAKLHVQFILFGREHCTARGCKNATCPICVLIHSS